MTSLYSSEVLNDTVPMHGVFDWEDMNVMRTGTGLRSLLVYFFLIIEISLF